MDTIKILSKLNGIIPDSVITQITEVVDKFSINTELRLAHFLSQTSHESGGFKAFQENLNYSAQGLANTWPKRYSVDPKASVKVPNTLAISLNRNPEKIANNIYANRMGNGDEACGDGWKNRGRGAIQLTGADNYKEFDKFVSEDIINNPDLVATKYQLLSAGWFWNSRSLNKIADLGNSLAVVAQVTLKINGGSIGLTERNIVFNKIYKAII